MSFKFFDVSVINPLTWPRRVINNTIAAVSDQNKGIWLGKKPLGDSGIGMTVGPGFDFFHWAIMIDGWLYEVEVDKTDGSFRATQDKDYINKFKWVKLPGESIRSHEELIEECQKSKKPYGLVQLPLDLEMPDAKNGTTLPKIKLNKGEKMNCQLFVQILYAYSIDILVVAATTRISLISGSFAF